MGMIQATSPLSPASITVSQNNYSPAGLAGAERLRLTSSGAVDITGLATGFLGRRLYITNIGANVITLKHANAGSSAANQFKLPGSADIAIPANGSVLLEYDSQNVWMALGKS